MQWLLDYRNKGQEAGRHLNKPRVLRSSDPNLPPVAVGPVQPVDWIRSVEHVLPPDKIREARDWYQGVYGAFVRHFGEKRAPVAMSAWLAGQKSASPSASGMNMDRAWEQELSGVVAQKGSHGEQKALKAGLNDAVLRDYLRGGRPGKGIGVKLSDFTDAGFGRPTRTYYGDDPRAGRPVVIDIHAMRDAGYPDQTKIDWLRDHGYDTKGLVPEFHQSPTPTQYENAADYYRNLTDYLNRSGWSAKHGLGELTPEQTQAIGWTKQAALTGVDETPETALTKNLRHVAFAAAPGEGSPWAKQFGARFGALPPAQQAHVTRQVLTHALTFATKEYGVNLQGLVHASGGWLDQAPEPNAVARLQASPQATEMVAHTLGYLLNQTGVWACAIKPGVTTKEPQGLAVDLVEHGGTRHLDHDLNVRSLWGAIRAADEKGMFQGYQALRTFNGEPGIRILLDDNAIVRLGGAKKRGADVRGMVKSWLNEAMPKLAQELPYDLRWHGHEADIVKAENNWQENPNGEVYRRRLEQLIGRDPTARLVHYGRQLTRLFKRELAAAEGRGAGAAAAPAASRR